MRDFIKDEDNDLSVTGNDLVIGVSDQQHQEDLILTEKGVLKQFIDTGVGAAKFIESEDDGGLLREIAMQFSADGMVVKGVAVRNKVLDVNAKYPS